MENLIALLTLDPQTRRHSRPLPPRRRRSHLNSASYRTLVRIFSLCFDESVNPPQEPRRDAIPISDSDAAAAPEASGRFSADTGSIVCRDVDGCLDAEFGRGFIGNDATGSDECGGLRLNTDSEGDLRLEEKSGDEKGVNDKTGNNLMPELPQLQFGDDKDEASHKMIELGHRHERCNQVIDGGLEEGLIKDSELETSHEENAFLSQGSESPVDVIFDCSKLIEVHDDIFDSTGALQGEIPDIINEKDDILCLNSNDQVVNLLDSNAQDVNLVRKSVQESKHVTEDARIDEISSDAGLTYSDALRKFSSSDERIESSATGLFPNRFLIHKPQEEASNATNKLAEDNQQKLLDSSTNNVISNQPFANLLNALLNSDSDEEVEEGQIPGDFWNSQDSELMIHQGPPSESQKSDKGPHYSGLLNKEVSDCSDTDTVPWPVNSEDNCSTVVKMDGKAHFYPEMKIVSGNVPVVGINQPNLSGDALISDEKSSPAQNKRATDMDIEVQKKRKRGALTEERKAKKKKAKRMKRAAKEREQGVRRLKLLTVVKPKVVKTCNYYLMGRCQKGDSCRYSHDATPLTKSQPCKHFACDSCLKGDDCPFDHELSKYPCHNFQSNGTCHRGDKCKFSHKIQIAVEGSSVSTASNLVSPITVENMKVGKQNNMKKKPANSSSPLEKTTSTKDHLTVKEPMQIPKGICFISFGNGPSERMKKPADSLLIKKYGCNEENPEKKSAGKDKNADHLSEKSLPKPQREFGFSHSSMKTFAGEYLRKRSSSSTPVAAPVSRSLHTEASKILEEFLFTAGG